MTIKHISLALLVAVLAWTGCKKDDDSNQNPDPTPLAPLTILPGSGIKEVKIGDAAQVAIDFFGPAMPASASAGGKYYYYIVYTVKGATINMEPTTEATFNPLIKIKNLKLTANFTGKTEKGIGIGSTKAEVTTAYGNPTSSSPASGDVYAIGITFFYDANSKVASMNIDKP